MNCTREWDSKFDQRKVKLNFFLYDKKYSPIFARLYRQPSRKDSLLMCSHDGKIWKGKFSDARKRRKFDKKLKRRQKKAKDWEGTVIWFERKKNRICCRPILRLYEARADVIRILISFWLACLHFRETSPSILQDDRKSDENTNM
jgi:hypothetical protein